MTAPTNDDEVSRVFDQVLNDVARTRDQMQLVSDLALGRPGATVSLLAESIVSTVDAHIERCVAVEKQINALRLAWFDLHGRAKRAGLIESRAV